MTNDIALAYASFTITGDGVDPEFWTRYFGVQPHIARMKGAPIRAPEGSGIAQRRTGVWSVRSNAFVRSDSLAPHLRFLERYLALPRTDLSGLVAQANARMRFFCYGSTSPAIASPTYPTTFAR
ncbi:MAG TPA: DUF4279 domain-containing protein [Paraburkholderia sp.]|uniref:DUF4279 domain-containing protein n=1 Tax=Paraburkholderia sp. TaxID=1926495 RepID=UPI002ED4924C